MRERYKCQVVVILGMTLILLGILYLYQPNRKLQPVIPFKDHYPANRLVGSGIR